MEQRLSLVTLASGDLSRAKTFYESGLGWKAGFANEEVVFFQLNGIVMALYHRASFAKELGVAETELAPGGAAIAYNTRSRDEVDVVVEQARRAGGAVMVAPHDTAWGGYSAYFRDPDGHLWEVAWNPAWAIDSGGNVQMAE